MTRREGLDVNNKRIRRLWRAEGLRVPKCRQKKRLTGIDANVVELLDRLVLMRCAPSKVRCGNGPEFVPSIIADWCQYNDRGLVEFFV